MYQILAVRVKVSTFLLVSLYAFLFICEFSVRFFAVSFQKVNSSVYFSGSNLERSVNVLAHICQFAEQTRMLTPLSTAVCRVKAGEIIFVETTVALKFVNLNVSQCKISHHFHYSSDRALGFAFISSKDSDLSERPGRFCAWVLLGQAKRKCNKKCHFFNQLGGHGSCGRNYTR